MVENICNHTLLRDWGERYAKELLHSMQINNWIKTGQIISIDISQIIYRMVNKHM